MHKEQYYPEDILIEKLESGEYGWLDFVNHHSADGRRSIFFTARKTTS